MLANTGVRHENVGEILAVADGCMVGTALKAGGDTWQPVDVDRGRQFVRLARGIRARV